MRSLKVFYLPNEVAPEDTFTWIIVLNSMVCSGFCIRVRLGEIFTHVMVLGRGFMTVFGTGTRRVLSNAYWIFARRTEGPWYYGLGVFLY